MSSDGFQSELHIHPAVYQYLASSGFPASAKAFKKEAKLKQEQSDVNLVDVLHDVFKKSRQRGVKRPAPSNFSSNVTKKQKMNGEAAKKSQESTDEDSDDDNDSSSSSSSEEESKKPEVKKEAAKSTATAQASDDDEDDESMDDVSVSSEWDIQNFCKIEDAPVLITETEFLSIDSSDSDTVNSNFELPAPMELLAAAKEFGKLKQKAAKKAKQVSQTARNASPAVEKTDSSSPSSRSSSNTQRPQTAVCSRGRARGRGRGRGRNGGRGRGRGGVIRTGGNGRFSRIKPAEHFMDDNSFQEFDEYGWKANQDLSRVRGKNFTKAKNKKKKNTFFHGGRISMDTNATRY